MRTAHIYNTVHYAFYGNGESYQFSVNVNRDAKGGLTSAELVSTKPIFNVDQLIAIRDFLNWLIPTQ